MSPVEKELERLSIRIAHLEERGRTNLIVGGSNLVINISAIVLILHHLGAL